MQIPRSVIITLLTFAATGLGIGGLLGAFIGYLLPDYYRVVFHVEDASFNPIAVGTGLGATQGVILGVVSALVLLALFHRRSDAEQ